MRWKLKSEPDLKIVETLQKELDIPYKNAYLLAQRDIHSFEEARSFFRPNLKDLHNPFLMKGMDVAVRRIEQAIVNKEKILVYGDYDVDGTTAVSIVCSYIKNVYPQVDSYIPDRYAEGYGISYQGIDYAAENGFSLVIALDCGIKAVDKITYANEKNIDFIIGDHHTPGTEIPKAFAILNPKQHDCPYPYKELSGAGIGFKLIQALNEAKGGKIDDILHYLDLVAVSIGADIVPITGENRVLAYLGLKQIEENPRPGLKAISRNVKGKILNISDLVFVLAPRINAAGRIRHGKEAVKLLVEKNEAKAIQFADEIEIINTERREFDKQMTIDALQQIIDNNETRRYTTVVYDENWHKGVVGIVASRLIETYYRPTIVFTKSNDTIAGSVRSVSGFNVYDALDSCSEHIIQFGGHKYAAGLSLLPEKLEEFKQKFEKVVKESIAEESLTPEIKIDTELKFNEITPKFFRILKQMAPFGPGNMNPVFVSKGLNDTGYSKKVGKDDNHLKLFLRDLRSGVTMSGIGFNMGDKFDLVKSGKPISIAYVLEENHWNGKTSLQLKIKDVKSLI